MFDAKIIINDSGGVVFNDNAKLRLSKDKAEIFLTDKKITALKDGMTVKTTEYNLKLSKSESLLMLFNADFSGSLPVRCDCYNISPLSFDGLAQGQIKIETKYYLGDECNQLKITVDF